MKTAVIGSRKLNVDIGKYIPEETTTIISGGARGIDTLAIEYADMNNIPVTIFTPKYTDYGKSAPLVRNKLIVESADFIVAIWDGQSRGTLFTINYAKKLNKPIKVYMGR